METQFNNIIRSLNFLKEVTDKRLQLHFSKESAEDLSYPPLTIEADNAPLNHFIIDHQLNIEEYIILLLALLPHIQPNFIDAIVQKYLPNGGDFAEIGGVKGNNHRGMLPTGETALFIIAGSDVQKRMQASQYFSPDHFFVKENVLALETLHDGEPRMSGKIILQQDYVDLFTTGSASKPVFSPDFPAKNISTQMEWSDLILNPKTEQQIQDIKTWLDHNEPFMKEWGMEKKVKPGFRALFYGPSGTGKTLTATLLGKQFNKEVYRIDLSQVVSKYIGETEKNLEKVFTKAEHKDWILFFDEADALFGKRSNVSNAHDKYANQEVSYLLQRVEDFPGLIILASNFKSNIDNAFIRRFNAIVPFFAPSAAERLQIWETSIPPKAFLAADVDLANIANKYELTGSSIVSIIHYASLQAIARKSNIILQCDLLEGIQREYEKEERVFTE
jgi:AAA+ superfamily predicted ATPase